MYANTKFMSEELNLVTQLATILIAAGIFTIISKALKQPLILGYIIAGFIVGPYLGLIPQFSPESVHEWSELGIIFLLFGLGLEFSYKKLLSVGKPAFLSAGTICIGMLLTGFMLGSVLGWSEMESIFLGGMMSMSSTTIIIKAYDDLGIKDKPYAATVFGLLVVEDLIAVLMMVMFSTMALTHKVSGTDMAYSLAKLLFFLILCFVIGIYLLPSLLKRSRKYLSDEILLIASVGLCFLMVLLANKSGFSSALGAFIMGSILSSTLEGEQISHTITNIKNLFGAIFFVSVGMMVDPSVIIDYWPVILAITLVAMAGILVFSTCGVLLSGKSLDTAVHIGFSLPQLGEFSFIIAGLGCSLGVLSDFIYPVIISVSVITTFTTPYMIKAADPALAFLNRKLPEKWLKRLNSKENTSTNEQEKSLWRKAIKSYLIRIGLYAVILTALSLAITEFLPMISKVLLPDLSVKAQHIIEVTAALVIMAPFVIGMAINGEEIRNLGAALIIRNRRNRIPIFALIFLRLFFAAYFVISIIMWRYEMASWNILVILGALFIIFLLVRRNARQVTRIERRFLENLKEKEEMARKAKPVQSLIKDKLAHYDVHIQGIQIHSDFAYTGVSLSDMDFFKITGVNIIKIQRGSRSIVIPSGNESLYPGDFVLAVGTSWQLSNFIELMSEQNEQQDNETPNEEFTVENHTLGNLSYMSGKKLSDLPMRSEGCMVISIMRGGDLITNPSADLVFREGDSVWFAGLRSVISWYK